MVIQDVNTLKKELFSKYYLNSQREIMDYKTDLQKLLDDFNKVKQMQSFTKENLLKERDKAIKQIDIEKIKKIDSKLLNFDKK